MSIRILIADDHPVVRSGVKVELNRWNDIKIIGEATTGDMAFEMAKTLEPDILILDIMMPGMKAFEIIRGLYLRKAPVRIMIFTEYDDRGTISRFVQLGVDGFLLKDEDPSVLPEAIRKITCGKKWVSPKVTEFLLENAQAASHQSEQPVLTEKEINVLRLISEGLSTKEIVSTLESKERTVEFHIKKIKTKLGVNTSAQAVAWAKDHGVL